MNYLKKNPSNRFFFFYFNAYICNKTTGGGVLLRPENEVRQRCLHIAVFMVEKRATVRQAAKVFDVSKSTVHKDMTERLEHINRDLYIQVRSLLKENKEQRHLRGGEATRRKYCIKSE